MKALLLEIIIKVYPFYPLVMSFLSSYHGERVEVLAWSPNGMPSEK